jgi:hypothetical protein
MKFGDLVKNLYASNNNPRRIMMYIGREGRTYKFICKDGYIATFEGDEGLRICGHIFIKKIIEDYIED